jgi:transposase-like protein
VAAVTRRRFDPEFRAGAVRIAMGTDRPVAQVTRIWGCSVQMDRRDAADILLDTEADHGLRDPRVSAAWVRRLAE